MIIKRFYGVPDWRRQAFSDEFDLLRRQFDILSDRLAGGQSAPRGAGVFPLVNLTEDIDNFYVRAELPGVAGDQLDIQATGTTVAISGERKIPEESKEARYHRRERESGSFSRMVTLESEIDPEKVDAALNNGVLTVTLPKAEQAKPRRIAINS